MPDDALPLDLYAERAYLTYAMSVVTGRALPHVEDGQKPVQRRILYAMHEMGLKSGAKPVKSARVVGDVIGKFHPHGDQSVYDAMVRVAQDFSLRYPLIDGQGNFGSRDGDAAAAMRYTEARLTPIAELLLGELDRGTVDFAPNYDGAFKEPVLLPARLPMVLLNGASGIAVGMATEIPPHNLREVAQAAIHLIRNPKAALPDLLAHVQGPDFPGGGQIISQPKDIEDAYTSGRGSLRMRARWRIEDLAHVRLFGGDRALGTRVSKKVRDAVLGEGKTWLDSAFVVNDWYVSGYEPVLDGAGKRVGMLYVGYLETPFAQVKHTIFATLIGLFAAVMAASSALLLWRARRVFKPLETMDATMAAVEAGDVTARVGAVPGRDEIARLAEHFDRLLDTLHERNAELSRLNTELDFKVIERTRELALALEELRAAQKQLVRSEKLAAIGQLTAGVAHEINNPIAVMQGNLDLLREELGEAAAPARNELRLLDEQIHRVRVIVTKLLQFARPDEFAGYVETVDVNAVVADCLVLVRHELKKGDIAVVQELRATTPVRVNRNELQQVLINLAVNAIHAMAAGGRLTFVSEDWEGKGVRIGVRDTGAGIAPEHLARVFDPFFTTKKTQGTGLGLSISLALIERYGGTISVDSRPGEGTEFSVFLLAEPVFREQEGLDTIVST